MGMGLFILHHYLVHQSPSVSPVFQWYHQPVVLLWVLLLGGLVGGLAGGVAGGLAGGVAPLVEGRRKRKILQLSSQSY